jgi:hypothetical protein
MFTSKLSAILEYLFHGRAFIPENIWKTQMKMELPYKSLNIRKGCRDSTDGKGEKLWGTRRSFFESKCT